MTLQEILDRVDKLDAEATKGPWNHGMRNGCNGDKIYAQTGIDAFSDDGIAAVYSLFLHTKVAEQPNGLAFSNAAFIAESRQLLPLLAKIVRDVREFAGVGDIKGCEIDEVAERVIAEISL